MMTLQANALVSVEEVFAYLRIPEPQPSDPQYQLIEALINRASDECENYVNGPIVNKTIMTKLDGTGADTKVLPHVPVQSITSVLVNGVDWTANVDFYTHGVIFTKNCTSFPEGRKNIDVTYVAGLGDTRDTIPQNLKHACLLIVQYWLKRDSLDYSQTFGESDIITGETVGVHRFPYTALKMLDPYRKVVI
jgi:uncharacterized phiE125 gp8 family phage protein